MNDYVRNLARRWAQNYNRPTAFEKEQFNEALFDEVDKLIAGNSEQAWAFLTAACSENLSEEAFSYLAAGPLEYLLVIHGEIYLGRLENELIVNEKFVKLFSQVWEQRGMSPRVKKLIRARS